MNRKIIQLIIWEKDLIALCDDGSIWGHNKAGMYEELGKDLKKRMVDRDGWWAPLGDPIPAGWGEIDSTDPNDCDWDKRSATV